MKFIIKNDSSASDYLAIRMVEEVVREGLVSGDGDRKQHCYVTIMTANRKRYSVYCNLNRSGSETFTIRNERNQDD